VDHADAVAGANDRMARGEKNLIVDDVVVVLVFDSAVREW
jgi:hypothetical protein